MRVGVATDHGGFELKQEFVAHLRAAGHDVVDFGAHSLDPTDDYPGFVSGICAEPPPRKPNGCVEDHLNC